MSGFYKKAVVWLGLNEEYPDVEPEPSRNAAASRPSPRPDNNAPRERATRERATRGQSPDGPRPTQPSNAAPQVSAVRAVERSASSPPASSAVEPTVRAIPMDSEPASGSSGSNSIGTVRAVAVPKTVKPRVIVPQSFNDAQLVADTFREPKPVIVNMQSAERDLARRLIDFSSGLCYGLGGQMEKVAKDVYLLTPDDVEVAQEDRDNY